MYDFYYNTGKAVEDKKAFDRNLRKCQLDLESGKHILSNEKFYKKYFDIKITPKEE